MESTEVSLNGEGGGGGGNSSKGGGGGGDAFIDRSKVRILVCDNDAKSLEEVSTLLLKCSYQGIYIYCFFLIFLVAFIFFVLVEFYDLFFFFFWLKSMVCLLTKFLFFFGCWCD